jgi:hypothetical protein
MVELLGRLQLRMAPEIPGVASGRSLMTWLTQ